MDVDNKIGGRKLFDVLLSNKGERSFVSFVNPFSYLLLKDNIDCTQDIDVFFIDGNLLRFLHCLFHDLSG